MNRYLASAVLVASLVASASLAIRLLPVAPEQGRRVEHANGQPQHPTPEERMADYTWWLNAFTFCLVVISGVQGCFIARGNDTARRSADASKISADAAEMSAKAAVAAERAYLIFKNKVALTILAPQGVRTGRWVARARIKNHGSTPAIITAVGRALEFVPSNQPTDATIKRRESDRVVLPSKSVSFALSLPVNDDMLDAIDTDSGTLVLILQIEYRDVFGNIHTAGLGYEYDTDERGFTPYLGGGFNYWT